MPLDTKAENLASGRQGQGGGKREGAGRAVCQPEAAREGGQRQRAGHVRRPPAEAAVPLDTSLAPARVPHTAAVGRVQPMVPPRLHAPTPASRAPVRLHAPAEPPCGYARHGPHSRRRGEEARTAPQARPCAPQAPHMWSSSSTGWFSCTSISASTALTHPGWLQISSIQLCAAARLRGRGGAGRAGWGVLESAMRQAGAAGAPPEAAPAAA